MPEENLSAFAAMRALRDELRARLDQNEDYRAWKALDEVLRELAPVDLAHIEIATPPEHTDAKLPQVDDADLSFVRRPELVGLSNCPAPDGVRLEFRAISDCYGGQSWCASIANAVLFESPSF